MPTIIHDYPRGIFTRRPVIRPQVIILTTRFFSGCPGTEWRVAFMVIGTGLELSSATLQ